MRRVAGQCILAATVAVLSTPVVVPAAPGGEDPRERVTAPVAVQRVRTPGFKIRDEAAMVLVGTMLIGLAAAVRRAA